MKYELGTREKQVAGFVGTVAPSGTLAFPKDPVILAQIGSIIALGFVITQSGMTLQSFEASRELSTANWEFAKRSDIMGHVRRIKIHFAEVGSTPPPGDPDPIGQLAKHVARIVRDIGRDMKRLPQKSLKKILEMEKMTPEQIDKFLQTLEKLVPAWREIMEKGMKE